MMIVICIGLKNVIFPNKEKKCDLEKWSNDKSFASVANESEAPSAHRI